MGKFSKYILMASVFIIIAGIAIATQTEITNMGITALNFSCNGCIGGTQVKESSLSKVPSASAADTATTWDGETSQANLNVNSSNKWDGLNTPADINTFGGIGGITLGGKLNAATYDIYGITNLNTTDVHATNLYGAWTPSANVNLNTYDIYGATWYNGTNAYLTGKVKSGNFTCTDCLAEKQKRMCTW